MNKILSLLPVAALLMLAGCTADEEADTGELVPISLTAEIEEVTDGGTRAGTSLLNSFSNGDQFGIALTNCVNASGSALSSTTYTVGTGFAAQPYITAGSTATVKGYYPSSASSATTFTVSDNQTSDANYKASDLMYASATATKASPSPTLTFSHKMAKIIVNVTATSGVSSITSVTLNNISRAVTFNSSTGEVSSPTTSGSITMSNNGAALIPPQTTSAGNNFLTIVTNAGTAYYKLGKTFSGGSVYTLNINVGLKDIGLTTTITGWNANGSATVNPTVETEVFPLSLANSTHVGKVICTNGHIHNTVSIVSCGGSGVAIIAYVGSAGSVDASSTTYKGLAIALSDVSGSVNSSKAWKSSNDGTCVSQNSNVSTAVTYKNGIASTNTLTSDGHTHSAASACRSYTPAAPTSYTSDWFLPSLGQWQLIFQGLASKKAGSSVTTALTISSNDTYKSSNLNSVITDAGGTGFNASLYWSSTEYSASNAWAVDFNKGYANYNGRKTYSYSVRPVLAF